MNKNQNITHFIAHAPNNIKIKHLYTSNKIAYITIKNIIKKQTTKNIMFNMKGGAGAGCCGSDNESDSTKGTCGGKSYE